MSRAAAKLAVAITLTVATVGAIAAACTPFGTANDGAGTVDEGGAGDSALREGGAADGGAIVDATVTDVGRPCLAGSCVDFDNGMWPSSWQVHGDTSALLVTAGATTSGAFALDVAFTDKFAFLSVDVSNASKVAVSANVLVVEFGDGEVDLLGIAAAPESGASGLYLVHPAAQGASLAIELPAQGQDRLSSKFTTYTPVRLELDLATKEYSYAIGSDVVLGKLTTPPAAASLAIVLGAVYAAGTTKAWRVRYDDVEIVTTK